MLLWLNVLRGVYCRGEEQGGILSAIKNVAGTIKENVAGGGGEAPRRRGVEEEVVTVSVEESRPGMAADLLKAADEMHGQTFNDPGKMGGEGTGKTKTTTRRLP